MTVQADLDQRAGSLRRSLRAANKSERTLATAAKRLCRIVAAGHIRNRQIRVADLAAVVEAGFRVVQSPPPEEHCDIDLGTLDSPGRLAQLVDLFAAPGGEPVPLRGLTSVRVDFGWDRGGLVRAFKDDASQPVAVGELVRAWDDDGTERPARVVAQDSDTIRLEVLPASEVTALDRHAAAG